MVCQIALIKRKDHKDRRNSVLASNERMAEMSLDMEKLMDKQLDALPLVR